MSGEAAAETVVHIGIKGGMGQSKQALQGIVLSYQQNGVEVHRVGRQAVGAGDTQVAAEVNAVTVALHAIDRPVSAAVIYSNVNWLAPRLNVDLPGWAAEGLPSKVKFKGDWLSIIDVATEKGIKLSGVFVRKDEGNDLVAAADALCHAPLAGRADLTPEGRREMGARGAAAVARNKAARAAEIDRQVRAAVERDTL